MAAAFAKISEAGGLYDHWLDVQLALPVEEEQWGQYAVQSLVWDAAGLCYQCSLSFIDVLQVVVNLQL